VAARVDRFSELTAVWFRDLRVARDSLL